MLATACVFSRLLAAQSPVQIPVGTELSATTEAISPKDDDALDRLIEEKCPGALKHLRQHAITNKGPAVGKPTRPALRRELLLMEQRDQETRAAALANENSTNVAAAEQVDAANLKRLKHIVTQDGFPTRSMVGDEGIDAAWLLTQHADSDPAFQAYVLRILAARVRQRAFDPAELAMLTDRVLIHQGKPQRYGSQFGNNGSGLKPGRMEDPAHVDQRRASVGLGTLAEYSCAMQVIYGTSDGSPGH
ncbi:MAG TPA: DUF6624 domain-containing protein [Steroidobacteraceae bacterium]|nr:DUF6624 domain-containing protein [Steroidobacteraceae bacterium]